MPYRQTASISGLIWWNITVRASQTVVTRRQNKAFEVERGRFTRRYHRGFGASSRPSNSVQVDVVRHRVRLVVSDSEFDSVALPNSNHRSRNLPVKRHVRVRHARFDFGDELFRRHVFANRFRLGSADGVGDIGRVCSDTIHVRFFCGVHRWGSWRCTLVLCGRSVTTRECGGSTDAQCLKHTAACGCWNSGVCHIQSLLYLQVRPQARYNHNQVPTNWRLRRLTPNMFSEIISETVLNRCES